MKKHLFFLRHYNDIDNIVPAIYFLVERENCEVKIVIYSLDYDYKSNKLLQFLEHRFKDRITINWIGEVLNYSERVRVDKRYRINNYRFRKLFRLETIERAIIGRGKDNRLSQFIEKTLKECDYPTKVIFDQNRTSVFSNLLTILREKGVKQIVSLPVSPWMNTNVLRQVDFIKLDADTFRKKHDYSGFDKIGQVDPFYSQSLKNFFQMLGQESPFEGKVEVLGSLRYSKEWLAVLQSDEMAPFLPPKLQKSEKRSVLILPSHPKNNSFWEEYKRTLHFVSQFDQYEFIIKPHTRYDTAYDQLPKNLTLDRTSTTTQLIDWSDIILFWSTSAALEGYQKGKVMVCLDFLNGNDSSYRRFNAGYICHSRDDLMEILMHNKKSDNSKLIKNYDSLISSIIGSVKKGNIAGKYIKYLYS